MQTSNGGVGVLVQVGGASTPACAPLAHGFAARPQRPRPSLRVETLSLNGPRMYFPGCGPKPMSHWGEPASATGGAPTPTLPALGPSIALVRTGLVEDVVTPAPFRSAVDSFFSPRDGSGNSRVDLGGSLGVGGSGGGGGSGSFGSGGGGALQPLRAEKATRSEALEAGGAPGGTPGKPARQGRRVSFSPGAGLVEVRVYSSEASPLSLGLGLIEDQGEGKGGEGQGWFPKAADHGGGGGSLDAGMALVECDGEEDEATTPLVEPERGSK